MVEILCPHCDEEIALEDDASGEFACPHCEGEFEWNNDEPDTIETPIQEEIFGYTRNQIALSCSILGIVVGILSFIVLQSSLLLLTECPEEYRSEFVDAVTGETSMTCDGGYTGNLGSVFTGLFFSCCLLFPSALALIRFSYRIWEPGVVMVADGDSNTSSTRRSILRTMTHASASGTIAAIGIVLLLVGGAGLYFSTTLLFEFTQPQTESFGNIAILFIIPILLGVIVFSAGLLFAGLRFIFTVLQKISKR